MLKFVIQGIGHRPRVLIWTAADRSPANWAAAEVTLCIYRAGKKRTCSSSNTDCCSALAGNSS